MELHLWKSGGAGECTRTNGTFLQKSDFKFQFTATLQALGFAILNWRNRHNIENMVRIKIHISGTVFEMDSKLLDGKGDHTLTKLVSKEFEETEVVTLNFDRPLESFTAILSYYQTGQLHMPNHVCPSAFKLELDYWNIPTSELQKCCLFKYYGFMDELDTFNRYRKYEQRLVGSEKSPAVYTFAPLSSYRRKLWNMIDFHEDTLAAKIYLVVVLIMVLFGILVLALETVPSLQRKAYQCELLEYLEETDENLFDHMNEKLGSPDCSSIIGGDYYDEYENYLDDYKPTRKSRPMTPPTNDTYDDMTYKSNNKTSLPSIRVPVLALKVADIIVAAFFTVDFLLRLFTCPSIRTLCFSVSNICDAVALAGFYADLIVSNTNKVMKYDRDTIRFIEFLQLVRVMRLFTVVRNLRASRVLVYSLRQNAKDMGLLMLFLVVVMNVSSCLVFFIESHKTFESIPDAWYWSIITITTVGYGDISPSSPAGKVIASLLAICGILLLALTLPMFVNNFLALYHYSYLGDYVTEKASKSEAKTKRKQIPVSANVTRIEPL